MLYDLKESAVVVGESTIDYAVFGKGTQPMVIIPGLSLRDVKGAGAGLALMYRLFAKDYRVYVLDKKADIPEGCTVKDLADYTAIAMEALGLSHAIVFGVSLGGMIALNLALDYPHLVDRLVLGVTLSRPNDTVKAVVNGWVKSAERGDFSAIILDMLEVMYSLAYAKRYRWLFPILAKFSAPKNKERFIRLAKSCLTCDVYDRLNQINCPTLILGGGQDKIVTGKASLEMAERLGCECHVYENLGHAAYEEAKDFNQRIYEFLKGCQDE